MPCTGGEEGKDACGVSTCIIISLICIISWVMGGHKWQEVSIMKLSTQGDSGGPLKVPHSQSGVHTLVGAVSFGFGCARVSNIFLYIVKSSINSALSANLRANKM